MNPQIIQNLRHKLQKRVSRLKSVSNSFFIPSLKQFWTFFRSNPTLVGIAELLLVRFPEVDIFVEGIFQGKKVEAKSEEETAAIGYAVLHRITLDNDKLYILQQPYTFPVSFNRETLGSDNNIREVIHFYLEPFYEYVDEKLDDHGAILSLLLRYKHRSEWFYQDKLFDLTKENTQKAEKSLALDLYSYLHDQGLNFSIEPSSLRGAIDLIAAQGSDDPLLADTKIFDADDRGKRYIRKAFRQIYTYTQHYNEPFGYLIIYKITDKDLKFSLATTSSNIAVITYNHKTIFFLTIDIYPHSKAVSQRDPLQAISITEDELIQTAQEEITEDE
ncbi:hypothetical protein A0J48_005440 [Sphaerospermopsis aphanizomenoides BCCUSP55]|uniref:hypothetical protein n=1 Tax=Sphaerospermopsis aphanizomenoides TaxID=459663 RepID=UPI001905D995|nr:hypothetical protein [Sphaerospermopsis aphanizomenoides]MBK1986988.1 hypothetical protein [Sphaerospermopsis aphanizomenoides BCCUSP55]